MFKAALIVASSTSLLALSACEDPSKNVAPAKVNEPAAKTPAKAKPAKGAMTFNGERSKVGFVGSKVTGSHNGGFKTFTGSINAPGGKVEDGMITVEIDMNSTWSDAEKLTGHLKSPDFFDVAKHAKSSFSSTKITSKGSNAYEVTGDLTLRGVKKSITFPATIEIKDGAATAKAEFSINRQDFDIKYPGKKDDLIRDGVVIKLDLKAS